MTENYDTINSESTVRSFWKMKKEHYPLEQKISVILDDAAYPPNRTDDKCNKNTQARAS
ncbi:TPA: hypothetical protein ACN37W_004115 [Vibrio parahaemolyticus]